MPAWSKRLPVLPGGRRSKWVVLVAWLILAVALGPLAGKFGDVEEDGPNAFLPSGAESARVKTELEKFRADELTAAVAVYTRDGGLTTADRAKVAADRARFAELAADGQRVARAEPSTDGQALITTVPLAGDDGLGDDVDAVREIADADAPPGLTTEVGGPAASLIDSAEVFDSLDSTLMIITGAVLAALLLITYRSPVLWLFPLLAVGFGAVLTQVTACLLARHAGLPVDPQSAGILMVLVFGVGTDYALLLIARYREELHQHADRHQAMAIALRRCGPAILASAGTIAIGLACLAFADINSSRSLGLVGAVGVGCAFVAMVTVLPALLVIAGRWVFWPFVPRFGTAARTGRPLGRDRRRRRPLPALGLACLAWPHRRPRPERARHHHGSEPGGDVPGQARLGRRPGTPVRALPLRRLRPRRRRHPRRRRPTRPGQGRGGAGARRRVGGRAGGLRTYRRPRTRHLPRRPQGRPGQRRRQGDHRRAARRRARRRRRAGRRHHRTGRRHRARRRPRPDHRHPDRAARRPGRTRLAPALAGRPAAPAGHRGRLLLRRPRHVPPALRARPGLRRDGAGRPR